MRPAAGGACGGPGAQLCQLLLLLPRVLLQLVALSLYCLKIDSGAATEQVKALLCITGRLMQRSADQDCMTFQA